MHLETYPISVNVGTQWKQVEDYKFDHVIQSNFTFLYIGNEENCDWLSSYFLSGIFTKDFIQAQVLLERMDKMNLPDVILIDLPLNKLEILNFYSFLEKRKLSDETILIYNESKLDINKIKFLKHKELIDDIVKIDSPEINYSNKISFLKKIKNYQALSRDKQVEYKNEKFRINPFKRFIDIAGSLLAIVLIFPLLILIGLAVKLGSRGPVIYTSMRAGRGFKIFKFFKFRTMVADADQQIEELVHLNQYEEKENGAKFLKIENDPRVTKLGKILRKTSLDELPQLFNVLKGDMSLVGNRPLPLYEASTLTTNEFVERFMAPAGITGLWQIKKRGRSKMSTEERIKLDILYARTASPILDLWIIARTPTALFQKTNV
jgi:lipopolysaccharide/colanic/teichoic acid biosynthesis glycosyltransferase